MNVTSVSLRHLVLIRRTKIKLYNADVPTVNKPIYSSDKQQVPEPPGCSSTTLLTNTESKDDQIQNDISSDELVDVKITDISDLLIYYIIFNE